MAHLAVALLREYSGSPLAPDQAALKCEVVYLVGGEQSIGAKIVLGRDAIINQFTTAEYIKERRVS